MVEWIVSSSVLIAVMIALRWLFRNRLKMTVRYALWGLVLLRLLLPFSIGKAVISVSNWAQKLITQPAVQEIIEIQIPVQSQESAYEEALESYRDQGVHVETLDQNTLNHIWQEAEKQAQKKPLGEILTLAAKLLWVTGGTLVAGFFLYSNSRFGRILIKNRRDTGTRNGKLPVFTVVGLDSPCLFGLAHPAIYLTEDVLADPTLLRYTLEHETTHYRHGDHIWAVLRGLCLAVHWYNPLVWAAAILSQRDGELACDEATVARLGEEERAEYGRTLIGMTCGKRANVFLTATRMTTGSLRQRILMLAKKPKTAGYILVFVAIIAAIAVGCTFTGAGKGEAQPTQPPEEIWDTKPYITYEGTKFYSIKQGVQSLPEGYEYIGVLSEEDARDLAYGGYQIFARKDREKLDHFYLYGETGTIIGDTYYDKKKQVAYILFGTEYFIPPDQKQDAQEDVFFRKYDPNGYYLGKAENYAVIYSKADTPTLRVLRYAWVNGSVQILGERTGVVKLTKGISVNHLELAQGHLYFGTLADQRGIWETIKLFCQDGSQKNLPILGRETWFCVLDAPLESFQILTANGGVAMNMGEFLKRNRVEEISFLPNTEKPVEVPPGSGTTQPQPTEPPETEPPEAFTPNLPSLAQKDPVPAEIENSNIGPLYSETDPTVISILVQPTGIARSGDHKLYVIPENQEAFMKAFRDALQHYEKGEYVDGGLSAGFYISYQGERWNVMTNGTMNWFYGKDGTIEAGALYDLCMEAIEKAGLEEPVRPEELAKIRSATLEWNGTHTITHRTILAKLEQILGSSEELGYGAGCPFLGTLTLKLENGEEKVISMAVDGCCAWMSNGVYYQYTDGGLEEELYNTVFFSLFASEIVRDAVFESKDPSPWLEYVNWSAYDAIYGGQETKKLMGAMQEWFRANKNYGLAFMCLNGLDEQYRPLYGEMLAQLAEEDKQEFAKQYFNTYEELRTRITALLSEHWNLTPEETNAKLRNGT